MLDSHILVYMHPKDVNSYLQEHQDNALAMYLVCAHFPWIYGMDGNSIELYNQGHLAMVGSATEDIQSLYDTHITFLLRQKLSSYLDDEGIGVILDKYLYHPQIVSSILDNRIQGKIKDMVFVAMEDPSDE